MRLRALLEAELQGAACDLTTLAHFPDWGLDTFAGLEEAMKLRQPREAMPLTVWIAFAALAFGSAAYLVGILLFDDVLALFKERE